MRRDRQKGEKKTMKINKNNLSLDHRKEILIN